MLKTYITLFFSLLFYSTFSFGILELELADDTEFYSSGDGVSFGILNHEDGGDESTAAGAENVYIPVTAVNVAQSFILPTSQIMGLTAKSAVGNNAYLKFSVSINIDSSDIHNIYAIGQDSSSKYKILEKVGSYSEDFVTSEVTFNVGSWCGEDDNFLDCSVFTASPEGEDESKIVAFVLRKESDGLIVGDEITLITDDKAIFLSLDFSSEVINGGVTSLGSRDGDRRLKLDYSGTAPADFYTTVACVSEGAAVGYVLNSPYASLACPRLDDLEITNSSGEVSVSSLTNGLTYHLTLFFVSKHKIATGSSIEVDGTPREIQALLAKQACFLLTAGFEGAHPIIDYFRNFRDTVLSQSFLGKVFIKQYYKFGPKAAPYVLKHKWLGQIIRTGAYTLHFIFKNIYFILIFLVSIIMIFSSFKIYRSRYGRP